MKILSVGAELHANGRTDGHDEANSRLWQLCERAEKRGGESNRLRIVSLWEALLLIFGDLMVSFLSCPSARQLSTGCRGGRRLL
jgi:hypothetical protein